MYSFMPLGRSQTWRNVEHRHKLNKVMFLSRLICSRIRERDWDSTGVGIIEITFYLGFKLD